MLISCAKQLGQMLLGVYSVVPQHLLSVFSFQELELLLVGQPTVDVDNWVAYTDHRGG